MVPRNLVMRTAMLLLVALFGLSTAVTLRGGTVANTNTPIVSVDAKKISSLIKAFQTLVTRLNNDQNEDSAMMVHVQHQCIHEQQRLSNAAQYLQQDIIGLTHRSSSIKQQIQQLTALEKDVHSEPLPESNNQTRVHSTEGQFVTTLLTKRLQDLRFKAKQTLERHAIKLSGLKSIQSSAQALADSCLHGLSAHETRTLSRREIGASIDYAERQIGAAIEKPENQASYDLRQAAKISSRIGADQTSKTNIEELTDKIMKMAIPQVMNDATDEAKRQVAGVASNLNLDNLHDHADIRFAFDQLALLRQAVLTAANTFEKAAANATRQRTRLEDAAANIQRLEAKEETALADATVQTVLGQQQLKEATHQKSIANSTAELMNMATRLTYKVKASSLLRSKAASLLLHELPAARSVLTAAQIQLRLVHRQRNPSPYAQLKEVTETVAQLRLDLGRAEDDETFAHWLNRGHTRSNHSSPAMIRAQLNTAETKRKELAASASSTASGTGASAADSEVEMSYRIAKQKVNSATTVVQHVEETVRGLLKHAQSLEQELVASIFPDSLKEGEMPPSDPLFASFQQVFLDDLDDDYEETMNASHVRIGHDNRLSEWQQFLASLNDRKSLAISSQLRAEMEATRAKESAVANTAAAHQALLDAQQLQVVRDQLFATALPNSLAQRARARQELEMETKQRDSALHLMRATTAAEEKELTPSNQNSSSPRSSGASHSSRPLAFETKLADIVSQVILKSGSLGDQVVEALLRKASVEFRVAKAVRRAAGHTGTSATDSQIHMDEIVGGIKGWQTSNFTQRQWAKTLHQDERNIRLALYKMLRTLQRGNVVILNAAKVCAEVDIIHSDIMNPGYGHLKVTMNGSHVSSNAATIAKLRQEIKAADAHVKALQIKLDHARLAQANPLFFPSVEDGGWQAAWHTETVSGIEKELERAKEVVITLRIQLEEALNKHVEHAESIIVAAESMYNTTTPKSTEYQTKMNECRALIARLPKNGVGLPPIIKAEAATRRIELRNAYLVWVRHLMEKEKDDIVKETKTVVDREIDLYNNNTNANNGWNNGNSQNMAASSAHAKQMSSHLIQKMIKAVHDAAPCDMNASDIAPNHKNIEQILNLPGFVKFSLDGAPTGTDFDMDSEIALLHSEDSEIARNGVSSLKERLPRADEKVMWEKYAHGSVPLDGMVKGALDRGRSFVRSSAVYRADVAARSQLASDLMTRLKTSNVEVDSLDKAASLWKNLTQAEQELKAARDEEEQQTVQTTSANAKDLSNLLKRLEVTVLSVDSDDEQLKHSAALRMKNGIIIEFDDIDAYASTTDNKVVFDTLKNLLAKQFGWSVPASWITTSTVLSTDNGALSATIRIDVPNLSTARRVASSLRSVIGTGQIMSKNIDLASKNASSPTTKMTVRWSDVAIDGIEIGTVPMVNNGPDFATYLTPLPTAPINATASGIKESANDDWYLDLKNNNGNSPSKNPILLATVWEGPQKAATYFDTYVAPVDSAERGAKQAHNEQILAQKHLVASELDLKALNLREEAINQLLQAVGTLSLDGESTAVDEHVLRLHSVLTLSNRHGKASIKYARATLTNIVHENLQNVQQSTMEAKKTVERVIKVLATRAGTNPIDATIYNAKDQTANDQEKDVQLATILEHDKLYHQLNEASKMLESMLESDEFNHFPKLTDDDDDANMMMQNSFLQVDEAWKMPKIFQKPKQIVQKMKNVIKVVVQKPKQIVQKTIAKVQEKKHSDKGYAYVGCYQDEGDRAMERVGGDVHSLNDCSSNCRGKNFKFMGIQHNECYCANNAKDGHWRYERYGKRDSGDCNRQVDGGQSGGDWRNAVYFAERGQVNMESKLIKKYVGCFKDQEDRAMERRGDAQDRNLEQCAKRCIDEKFKFMGMQHSECYCSQHPNKYARYGQVSRSIFTSSLQDKC